MALLREQGGRDLAAKKSTRAFATGSRCPGSGSDSEPTEFENFLERIPALFNAAEAVVAGGKISRC